MESAERTKQRPIPRDVESLEQLVPRNRATVGVFDFYSRYPR